MKVMISILVLAMSNFSQLFVVEMDTSVWAKRCTYVGPETSGLFQSCVDCQGEAQVSFREGADADCAGHPDVATLSIRATLHYQD
ncbi:hypothetical protein KFK09_016008 [Dendrobium nobile]|uniref:Secreted protein n=1 Tax=Dendrobium nobile TaxID=94219 RepID=A0A8T3B7J8_DENNO|nr:hypothetical protein KFK09_016008 [Dendrobium nobile]